MITSWSELTIRKFQEINKIQQLYNDEDEKVLRCAAVCAGITYDEIINKPIKETAELISNIAFLYGKPKSRRLKREYIINGKKYIPLKDFQDITTAQFIDFQAISTVCFEMLGEFLAIFMIPEGKKYNTDYRNSDVVEDIYDYFNVEEALALAHFFIKRYVKYVRKTMAYWEAQVTTIRLMTRDKEQKQLMKEVEKQLQNVRKVSYMFG